MYVKKIGNFHHLISTPYLTILLPVCMGFGLFNAIMIIIVLDITCLSAHLSFLHQYYLYFYHNPKIFHQAPPTNTHTDKYSTEKMNPN